MNKKDRMPRRWDILVSASRMRLALFHTHMRTTEAPNPACNIGGCVTSLSTWHHSNAGIIWDCNIYSYSTSNSRHHTFSRSLLYSTYVYFIRVTQHTLRLVVVRWDNIFQRTIVCSCISLIWYVQNRSWPFKFPYKLSLRSKSQGRSIMVDLLSLVILRNNIFINAENT